MKVRAAALRFDARAPHVPASSKQTPKAGEPPCMAMAPPVSAKARLVARKKRPSVVSSLNGLQFTYEKRPGILFRAGRTTSWYVVALNRRSSSGLAPLGDGTKAAVLRARPVEHPRSPSARKVRMPCRCRSAPTESGHRIRMCILQGEKHGRAESRAYSMRHVRVTHLLS